MRGKELTYAFCNPDSDLRLNVRKKKGRKPKSQPHCLGDNYLLKCNKDNKLRVQLMRNRLSLVQV